MRIIYKVHTEGALSSIDMVNKIKAVALWSGGLDSILAVKLIVEQGNVSVHPVRFITPFSEPHAVNDEPKTPEDILKDSGLILETITLSSEYFGIIKNPEYGYGKNMNPVLTAVSICSNRQKSTWGSSEVPF